jgi:hypothetical protein
LRKGELLSCFESIVCKYTLLGATPIRREREFVSNLKIPIS